MANRVGPLAGSVSSLLVVLAILGLTAGCGDSSDVNTGSTAASTTAPTSSATTTLPKPGDTTTTLPKPGDTTTSTAPPTVTTTPGTPTLAGSGVIGRAIEGPGCPVEVVGQPCPPAPAAVIVEVVDVSGDIVGSGSTNSDGWFAISAPPGSYTLRAQGSNGFPFCDPETAIVEPSEATRTDLTCDSGIR
jgi:hypothetical protein